MSWLRRKRLTRRLAVVVLGLAVVAGALWWSRRGTRYVPGTGAEGLTDTLARELPDQLPEVVFADVTEAAGIRFLHFPGTRSNRLPEDMGSGVALADVDGDGWTDVFLVNASGPLGSTPEPGTGRCALLRNLGDGTFGDVGEAAGIGFSGLGMAAAFLDGDGDGDLDLLLTSYGGLHYYRNDGELRFVDVTAQAGLEGLEGFWAGVAVGDYDLDGWLDVYVCGYVRYEEQAAEAGAAAKQFGLDIPVSINPSAFEPERNLLLRGRGDGSFEELAQLAGVANEAGRSLGATFADLTGDGLPDLYVANDVSDNALFVNLGDGTFADRTSSAMVGDYRGAMGLSVGDFDGDLDPDFFVTHWVAQENGLYENLSTEDDGTGERWTIFMDAADRYGLGHVALEQVGWATGWFDYDRDGRLDLFVVNGSTIPLADDPSRLVPMRSQLFWNGPEGKFFELGQRAGSFFEERHVGRGGATFDYDLDGDEDLLISVSGGGPHLLRNDGGNAGRSILVRLRQPAGNRFAIGARVLLEAGPLRALAESDTQGSYLSQHPVGELAFGLGRAARVERLTVTWPDGVVDQAGPFPVDSLVHWTRGSEPRAEILPGKRARVLAGPPAIDDQRTFHRLRDEATHLRIDGDLEGAVERYLEALALWPSHEDALYYLGSCRAELGQGASALQTWRELVLYHPNSSKGWMQIGNLHLNRADRGPQDLEVAEASFARSHAINGEESLPVVRLGRVALLRGDLGRARRLLADAALLNSSSVEARYFLGRIAWLEGDEPGARTWLAEAHAIARSPAQKGSPSSEGDTRTGAPLTAGSRSAPASSEPWRDLAERDPDPAAEYGARTPDPVERPVDR